MIPGEIYMATVDDLHFRMYDTQKFVSTRLGDVFLLLSVEHLDANSLLCYTYVSHVFLSTHGTVLVADTTSLKSSADCPPPTGLVRLQKTQKTQTRQDS